MNFPVNRIQEEAWSVAETGLPNPSGHVRESRRGIQPWTRVIGRMAALRGGIIQPGLVWDWRAEIIKASVETVPRRVAPASRNASA